MSEFLTQADLANRLVQKSGIDPESAKKFAALFFAIVKKGLKDSESLAVHNFGTFKKTWIETTTALNPQTGEKVEVPAHWRIKFIPCAAVARRINKPYARLKPKLIKEPKSKNKEEKEELPEVVEQESNDDLLAAETIRAEQAAQQEVQEEITAEDIVDEKEDLKDSETEEKKPLKLYALIAAGILLLILLIVLLVRSCSKDSSTKETSTAPAVEKPAEQAPEIQTAPEPERAPQPKEEALTQKAKPAPAPAKAPAKEPPSKPAPAEVPTPASTYTVPSGSSYYKIAELKYKNRHLWPLIYAANKNTNPDPDMVAQKSTVAIPALPAGNEGIPVISDAIVEAYEGYIALCKKEPESKKNALRTNRAVRVIVSGELLQKGFIDSHSSRFQPEHIEQARTILQTQYK